MATTRFEVKTRRLRLLPLDFESLEILKHGRPALEAHLGLTGSGLQLTGAYRKEIRDALGNWMEFTLENPERFAWGTNWEVIHTSENRSIGGIGMSGLPDEEGKVTLGYVIDRRYQGQGFASEAVNGLCEWAFREPSLKNIEALTPVDNRASQRVLEKTGFNKMKTFKLESLELFAWSKSRSG